jgi:hypothetical protein
MKSLFLLPILLAVAFADDDTCPNYGAWLPWTDQCLWFPFTAIRQGVIDACDVTVTGLDNMGPFPTPPASFPTEPCGHCSFKFRCRKRAVSEGCNPIDGEMEHCHEGSQGEICTFPKIQKKKLGCKYAVVPEMLKQCANRQDIPEWRVMQKQKFSKIVPKFHCIDEADGDGCKCCCHPYAPNAEGTECVLHQEPECEPYSDWNDWSEKCLFFPPKQMKKDFEEHCDFKFNKKSKEHPIFDKLKLPGDLEPTKCGMCSFQVKCRQRSPTSAAGKKECFPLDVQKRACGNEQCEGCGDVCELPKIGPDCNYNEKMRKILGPAIKSRMKKMPVMMRHHLLRMIMNLPHGKCVEADGKCKCCCHPYEPNADGSACVLKNICKTPEEAGVEFDMNLPDDDSFFW